MNNKKISAQLYHLAINGGIMAFGLGLLFYSKETAAGAAVGLNLCATAVFPSLFPFFVLSNLFVLRGLAQKAAWALNKPASALFGISGSGASAFILGIIGGYPVGAKTAVGLYQSGVCSRRETQRLLCFCNNSGPAFILGVVGVSVLGGGAGGLTLYLVHIAASALVGILFKVFGGSVADNQSNAPVAPPTQSPFAQDFIKAVTSAFNAMLGVCAFVIFFAVVIRLLEVTGVIGWLSGFMGSMFGALGMSKGIFSGLLKGGLEVTSGLWSINALELGSAGSLTMAAFMLGWAGLSVHFQTMTFIADAGLSASGYFFGKLLHGTLSALLVLILITFFPISALTFEPFDPILQLFARQQPDVFLLSSVLSLAILIIFLILSYFSIVFYKKKLYNRHNNFKA